MATFVPTTPLLTTDQASVQLAKTVVETSPGVFALNTISGGGTQIKFPIQFNKLGDIPLSSFTKLSSNSWGYSPDSTAIIIHNKSTLSLQFEGFYTMSFNDTILLGLPKGDLKYISYLYEPVGLPGYDSL